MQVLLLAVTFEDGQGLLLLAVLANQPAMHYGWSWLCEWRAGRCATLGRLLSYSTVATDEPPETETDTQALRAMQERVRVSTVISSPATETRPLQPASPDMRSGADRLGWSPSHQPLQIEGDSRLF